MLAVRNACTSSEEEMKFRDVQKFIKEERKYVNLTKADREAVLKDLNKVGMDGNGRFSSIGKALGHISAVLDKHGLEVDDVFSADRFREDKGQPTFHLAKTNQADLFSPVQVDNSLLVISYTKLSPDRYEVVAYLS